MTKPPNNFRLIFMTSLSLIGTCDDSSVQTWARNPMALHCVFRFEMEHLLARTGFEMQAVYSDFFKSQLNDVSSEMIWVAHKP